jgi:hypothetical protein
MQIREKEMKPKWFAFTQSPGHACQKVCDSEEDMKLYSAEHKARHPGIPVYCIMAFEVLDEPDTLNVRAK